MKSGENKIGMNVAARTPKDSLRMTMSGCVDPTLLVRSGSGCFCCGSVFPPDDITCHFLLMQASRAGYPSVAHYLMSTKQKIQVDSGETITETKPTSVGNNNAPKRTPKSLVKSSGAESQEVKPYPAMVEEKIGSQKESQVNATVRTRKGIQSKVEKYFCGVKPTSKKVHMAQNTSKKKK